MTTPPHEHVSRLRWLAIVALVVLFLSENLNVGFDVWREPVPYQVYWGIIAIALGIDFPTMRTLFLTFLRGIVGDKK